MQVYEPPRETLATPTLVSQTLATRVCVRARCFNPRHVDTNSQQCCGADWCGSMRRRCSDEEDIIELLRSTTSSMLTRNPTSPSTLTCQDRRHPPLVPNHHRHHCHRHLRPCTANAAIILYSQALL